jgi:uncharacterized membrane protein YraQ (UPF0718 family)
LIALDDHQQSTLNYQLCLSNPWFTFSFADFSYAFLSVLLEGVPFILIGTLLSGVIDEFLPSRVMVRFLPRNAFLGICLSGAMGLVFPMCECGIVPVIRRLINKGLPVSNAIAYMLAAPIVNPIVILSTYAAFRGQNPAEFTSLRVGVGYFVAVIVALAVHNLPLHSVLRRGVLSEVSAANAAMRAERFSVRLGSALRVAVTDFLDVMVFFVLGVAVSALFSTSVNQELIMPLALNDWIATSSMMGFAAILSLCSTSDAFIAATLIAFPGVAKLAFLVFGPMFDLKLLFIYSAVFRKRFVAGLAVGLFLLIGLICVRLTMLGL